MDEKYTSTCPTCHKEQSNDSKYCPECGTMVIEDSAPAIEIKELKERKKINNWIIILICFIIVGGAVLIVQIIDIVTPPVDLNKWSIIECVVHYEQKYEDYGYIHFFKQTDTENIIMRVTLDTALYNDMFEGNDQGTKRQEWRQMISDYQQLSIDFTADIQSRTHSEAILIVFMRFADISDTEAVVIENGVVTYDILESTLQKIRTNK